MSDKDKSEKLVSLIFNLYDKLKVWEMKNRYSIDLSSNEVNVHVSKTESFKITLIDTGLNTNTAGRIKKIQQYIGNDTFLLTYGDGLADIDINNLVSFHKSHKRLATLTTIQTPGRFGNLEFSEDSVVTKFIEKPQGDGMWISIQYFSSWIQKFR